MADIRTLAERQAIGREARSRAKRSSNAEIGNTDRDPVALLEQNSAGRVEALVPLRRASMAEMRPMRRRANQVKPMTPSARTRTVRIGSPTLHRVVAGRPR